MPYWYEWRDLNPQSIKRQILSLMCIPFHHTRNNSIIHQTILQVNSWYPEWDSNSQNFSFWERWLFQFVYLGTGGHSESRTRTLSIMSWRHYLYAKCPMLVEDVGIEPTDHIPIIYSLANCCITILPIFLNWCAMMESNHHPEFRRL